MCHCRRRMPKTPSLGGTHTASTPATRRGSAPSPGRGGGARGAGAGELAAGRDAVRRVLVADELLGYIVDIVGATRHSPALQLGVSPRGATALLATARSWSWLTGRGYVTPDDVKAMARPTLRHRVMLRPEAQLEGATPDGVLDGILASVPVPR